MKERAHYHYMCDMAMQALTYQEECRIAYVYSGLSSQLDGTQCHCLEGESLTFFLHAYAHVSALI